MIATEEYSDPAFSRLPGTARDAEELARVLGDPLVGDFDVSVLENRDVRTAGRRIGEFFRDAEPGDILLLSIAGHGVRNDEGHLYFAVTDTVPDALWVTALAAKDITHEMETSPARRIVVLLDCCYAGAFDERKNLDHAGPRPAPAPPVGSAAPDELVTDDAHVRGQVVIAAATSIEQAVEGRTGGLFTRCVVEGLRTGAADLNRDGEVDAHELHLYVHARMSELGAGVEQHPTYSVHRLQGMLRLAHRAPLPPGAAPPVAVTAPPVALPPSGTDPPPDSASRRRAPRALLLVAVLLTGCGVQADTPSTGGCPTPAHVRVAADPAGIGAYRDLAAEFEGWVAAGRHGCRSADLYVYPVPADQAADGLRHGWDRGPDGRAYLRDVGPHPDVWLPGAGSDVPALDPALATVVEVARTPVVLGVPEKAGVPADLRRAVLPWPELFDRVSRATGVVRGDPRTSAVAGMATARLYAGGTIGPAAARTRYEQRIERALDVGRYPVGDEAGLLCRHAAEHGTAAVVLTEQQLVRFNRGDPAGGPCARGGPPQGGDRLRAFYPADTPAMRQAVVTLTWPAQRQASVTRAYAAWFARWLRTDPGRAALLRAGLRPYAYDAGEPLGTDYGALTDWPFARVVQSEPDALTRRDVQRLYAGAGRPGRFLVALDASGSMNTVTADPTRTRWEVAVAAVERAAARLGGRDRFGLLTFAATGGRATRDRVPLGPSGQAAVSRVRAATATVRPAGDTPLYEAVRRGSALLRAGDGTGDPLRTLVVLTDGQDTSGQPRPTAAQTAGVRVFVIAVGTTTCADAGLRQLAEGTGGRCFDAGAGSPEPVLGGMFRAIWG
ncbi:caspase, EACC1-associated type [Actinoplanes sp. NPDC049316]|uniref:caspase, EACC1-associated type n=1 Tax=Actinoplanes sp. NPDC049316 TaxID=3154727 RepID=UPI00343B65DA